MKVYSGAFTTAQPSSDVLVEEVKADLEEMYKEVRAGKMAIPNLDRNCDFSNDESPDVFGSRASFRCAHHHMWLQLPSSVIVDHVVCTGKCASSKM